MDRFRAQTRLFKALAHPVRLRIVEALDRAGEACVCHLESVLDLRQAYLSQQLSVLRRAGIVQDQREGMNVFYSLSPAVSRDQLNAFRNLAAAVAAAEGWPIQPVERVAEAAGDCPCPRCAGDG